MIRFLGQLKEFYLLFSKKERRQLTLVFLGMLITGIFEVAGVGSVVPFLAVAGNPEVIQTNSVVAALYSTMGFSSREAFIIVLGIAVILFLVLSNAVKAIVYYFTIRYTRLRMAVMTSRLFRHFLLQPYYFFLNKNSSDVLKNLLDDLPKTLDGIFDPLLDLLSKAIIVLGLVGLVLVTDPVMAIGTTAIFGFTYLVLFGLIRKPIGKLGKTTNQMAVERFRNVNEALGGVKEVKFSGVEHTYLDRYERLARTEFLIDAKLGILSAFPKYFLEVLAFGGIIGIVLIYLAGGRNLGEILPVLGLYAFAGYRLMPYLQQIFADVAKIRFTAVRLKMTLDAFDSGEAETSHPPLSGVDLPFARAIEIKNLTFRYPRSDKDVLRSLSLKIPVRSTVGLVGFSGAGKSTLVDLLLGLLDLPPDSVLVDDRALTPELLGTWKSKIGYVPQQIYLADASIAQNIAFGTEPEKIDRGRVERAAQLANLDAFIQTELPEGYDTVTGERGVRLSGGQRQRIGIARALYREPEVLILDEATSALDGITETAIMDAIHSLGHSMTILIIAHRLTTLKECDEIFVLDSGQVTDSGTYHDLLGRNVQFREMAGRSKVES